MERFDFYVFRRLLVQLAMIAIVLFAVYWINRSIRIFNTLMTDGQTVVTFLEYSFYLIPQALNAILPAAAFWAATYSTYVMYSDKEMEVFQGSGMGPFRLVRPYAVFGLLAFAVASVLLHFIVPAGHRGNQQVSEKVRNDFASRRIQAGRFLFPADGIMIFVRGILPDGQFDRIFIYDSRDPTSETTYFAESASLYRNDGTTSLIMRNGQIQELKLKEKSLVGFNFAELKIDLPAPSIIPNQQNLDIKSLSTWDLLGRELSRDSAQEALERFSRSLYSLLFPLLGVSTLILGFTRIRLDIAALFATGIVLGLFLMGNYAESLTLADIRFWPGMVLPSAVCALLLLSFLGLAQRHGRKPNALMAAD